MMAPPILPPADRRDGPPGRRPGGRVAIALTALSASTLAACGTPVYVPDARGVEPISSLTISCGRPYALTRDCSMLTGASRKIAIQGVAMRIAGTEDGRIVLLTGPDPTTDAMLGRTAQVANFAYEVAKNELLDTGLTVVSVTPVQSMGALYGYVIESDGDAYTVLLEHATDD